MIIICIILTVLVGLLGYLLYINVRKLNTITTYCEAYVQFINAMYLRFQDTRERMKEIDRIGAFQADDEVGVTFKNLDECIDELHDFLSKYVNTNTNDEEDKKTKN
jgi:hypothetical protein